MLKTFDELCNEESLCEYCDAEPGWHSTGGGDPYCCEGTWCKEAYERYLDEIETTENIVKYASVVKLTNKEEFNGNTTKIRV